MYCTSSTVPCPKSSLRGSVISDPMANKCDLPGKEDVTFATFTPSSKGAFDYAHAKSGTGALPVFLFAHTYSAGAAIRKQRIFTA